MKKTHLWRLALPLVAASCATSVADNRRTLNLLDAHVAPESATLRWVALPVTFPTGVLGLVTDAVIVHPCCVIDDAWGDTVEWLWDPRDESRFRRAVMVPLRALATPFVFAGDWLTRAMFAVPPRKEKA